MALQQIPLDTSPNQSFNITLDIDGQNTTLRLTIRFNELSGYWLMDIANEQKISILQGIPLVSGVYPADNLLGQYGYLNIGSAFLLRTNDDLTDIPNETNLGTSFVLVWGDTL